MAAQYILAIDQGTTGTTSLIVDLKSLQLVGKSTREFAQIYPTPGEVEHNLNDIWRSVVESTTNCLAQCNINATEIAAIGITNQRETVCAFDKKGQPLANALVWQDRRTSSFCEELKKAGHQKDIAQKCGLTLDPYFSATKMRWLLQNDRKVQACARENNLKLGTIDTWLIYQLTGQASFVTEPSNASRTLLMDLRGHEWDHALCDLFQVPSHLLAQIQDSFSLFGKTKGLSFLPDGIPITGLLGDQQAALFGQNGAGAQSIKCTYGTGAFLLLNTGDNIIHSRNGLLTTVAYQLNSKRTYALEGSCYIAGAAVSWLRDNLRFFSSSAEIEQLASKVKNLSELRHILFFPFFTGIGSPYWKSEAKASLIGLTRDSQQEHVAHAALEGIALSIEDLLGAFAEDSPWNRPTELRVDGGVAANNYFLQMQSNFSQITIARPQIIETTGYGAACAAAIGLGAMSFDQLEDTWQKNRTFAPSSDNQSYYQEKKLLWAQTLKRLYL